MNIKAIIPAGITEITVNGLHQWDYGRKLEIHSPDLPALVEVHFACVGMDEAVIRPCSVAMGVAVATIPDRCLEHTAPIVAWVYGIDGTAGTTLAKINLVVEPRTRPCPSQDIPVATSDKYTEAITAMNEAVDNLVKNNVTVARAIADEDGKNIPATYATKAELKEEMLSTDIFAKADELSAAYRNSWGVKHFCLSNYPTDSTGQYVNLPIIGSQHSHATILIRYGDIIIFLWTYISLTPLYYIKKTTNETWDGKSWVAFVDSQNIGTYTAKRAQHTLVSLYITVRGGTDSAASFDLTYYQDGVKKTIESGVAKGALQNYNITADLGSQLSMSNTWGAFAYDEDEIPLVTKSRSGAVGSYEYKTRFVVTGGGTVAVSISDKG